MKVLVVGCGSIGARHATNLGDIPGVDVIAYDADRKRLDELADRSSVTTVDSIAGGLSMGPRAAVVCTPTHTHAVVAEQLLRAGLHVFVEKPIALTVHDADRLLTAADEAGVRLAVGCNFRFHPALRRLADWVREGRLGRVVHGRFSYGNHMGNWRARTDYRNTYSASQTQSGGILMDAIHEFDKVRWLVGEPREVWAVRARSGVLDASADDLATVVMQTEGGAVAEIQVDSFRPYRQMSATLIGDKAIARWHADGKAPERGTVELRGPEGEDPEVHHYEYDLNLMYVDEMHRFLEALDGKAEFPVDGAGGRRALELALQARQRSGFTPKGGS